MKTLVTMLALAALPLAATAQQLAMQDSGGVQWVCGGVGEEEREGLAALESKANLSITFAAGKRGAYLADVQMSLYGAGEKSPSLDIKTDGPICLLHAAPGRYRIEASFDGAKRTAQATVAADAKRPVRVVLVFPEQE